MTRRRERVGKQKRIKKDREKSGGWKELKGRRGIKRSKRAID